MNHKPTPRYGHKPIEMNLIVGDDDFGRVGDFYWESDKLDPYVMWVAIPSATGLYDGFDVIRIQCAPIQANKIWQWNSNKEKPTLSPSIHTFGVWHGHIQNGFLIEA